MDLDTTQVEAAQTVEPAANNAAIPVIKAPDAVVGTSEPAAPVAEAEVKTPAAPAADAETPVNETIAEYNARITAELEGQTPEVAEDVDVEAVEATEASAETADAEAVGNTFTLTPDVPLDEFTEKKAAYLATVEVTPELQAILDYQDAQIAGIADLDAVGGKENLVKFGTALTRLFETEIDPTGKVQVNATPLISELRTAYKDEFRPIMEEGLSSDSTKYQGASLLEEILIDTFGGEKATKMLAYASSSDPLPITPPNLLLPQGLDETLKEAYVRLPDVKREQIQTLVQEINELTEEAKDAGSWRQQEIATELAQKKAFLDYDYQALKDNQQVLNNERDRVATNQRQEAEKIAEFRTKVASEYNTEILGLADTLVADLAPRLSYADADTQVSQARNIMSRINNALAFNIGDDGSIVADPMAAYYAKQLTDEGVKFDFTKGRELLQAHYKATEKLTQLRLHNRNPQQIQLAERDRNKIMFDIKTEQKVLLGQLSSKYVKSNANAIGKQVDAIQQKKQAVRSITSGKPETRIARPAPRDEIAAYNREMAKRANGDELFDFHAS